MNLIYSNTPNPIIFERFKAIKKINKTVKLFYIERRNSKITLPFLNEEGIEKIFVTKETMNSILPKISYIFKTSKFILGK